MGKGERYFFFIEFRLILSIVFIVLSALKCEKIRSAVTGQDCEWINPKEVTDKKRKYLEVIAQPDIKTKIGNLKTILDDATKEIKEKLTKKKVLLSRYLWINKCHKDLTIFKKGPLITSERFVTSREPKEEELINLEKIWVDENSYYKLYQKNLIIHNKISLNETLLNAKNYGKGINPFTKEPFVSCTWFDKKEKIREKDAEVKKKTKKNNHIGEAVKWKLINNWASKFLTEQQNEDGIIALDDDNFKSNLITSIEILRSELPLANTSTYKNLHLQEELAGSETKTIGKDTKLTFFTLKIDEPKNTNPLSEKLKAVKTELNSLSEQLKEFEKDRDLKELGESINKLQSESSNTDFTLKLIQDLINKYNSFCEPTTAINTGVIEYKRGKVKVALHDLLQPVVELVAKEELLALIEKYIAMLRNKFLKIFNDKTLNPRKNLLNTSIKTVKRLLESKQAEVKSIESTSPINIKKELILILQVTSTTVLNEQEKVEKIGKFWKFGASKSTTITHLEELEEILKNYYQQVELCKTRIRTVKSPVVKTRPSSKKQPLPPKSPRPISLQTRTQTQPQLRGPKPISLKTQTQTQPPPPRGPKPTTSQTRTPTQPQPTSRRSKPKISRENKKLLDDLDAFETKLQKVIDEPPRYIKDKISRDIISPYMGTNKANYQVTAEKRFKDITVYLIKTLESYRTAKENFKESAKNSDSDNILAGKIKACSLVLTNASNTKFFTKPNKTNIETGVVKFYPTKQLDEDNLYVSKLQLKETLQSFINGARRMISQKKLDLENEKTGWWSKFG